MCNGHSPTAIQHRPLTCANKLRATCTHLHLHLPLPPASSLILVLNKSLLRCTCTVMFFKSKPKQAPKLVLCWCMAKAKAARETLMSIPRATAQDCPFRYIRSSIACLHPPHPPIILAPAASPPAARATSFAPSPVPSSLLLSSSPAPLSASPAWHAALCCLLCSVVHHGMLPARVRSGPREHQRRARSDDDAPWSPSSVDYRYSVLVCDRIDNWHNTRYLYVIRVL